jgi:hypothetical protein
LHLVVAFNVKHAALIDCTVTSGAPERLIRSSTIFTVCKSNQSEWPGLHLRVRGEIMGLIIIRTDSDLPTCSYFPGPMICPRTRIDTHSINQASACVRAL